MRARIAISVMSVGVVMLVFPSGCKKERQIDGIGEYRLSETILDHGVKCAPMGEYQWCSHNSQVAIGGQGATVDLYFKGSDPKTKAAEILIAIGRCQVQAVDSALATQLGEPAERHGTAVVWRNPSAVIVAKLPASDGTCEVSFLRHSEEKRFAELIGKGPKAAPKK